MKRSFIEWNESGKDSITPKQMYDALIASPPKVCNSALCLKNKIFLGMFYLFCRHLYCFKQEPGNEQEES